ncbi:MAG: YebC/PmpR family DNA-binding transcriptional regulator [Bacteroidetes bacterium]|jgi:YebC/PmpR family DNA-binding regulatory protein|nr:YebC/PmpR family DNA-binding transcriptional regulator [Bacteroidota bacterium]MBU6331136.1 YebC/PmpR family DNA-binding transcriptional regulator [Bacteroidota bacterium]
MGRAFEYRKARKMARWGKMSRIFPRISKEITMATKAGGPDPENNSRLRVAIQNAKGALMPKDRVEAAIKRATNKDEKDYEEVVYEGYGPHGVAIVVETATDNPTRTVANVRHLFSKYGGSMGTTGSLSFLFERKGIFRIKAEDLSLEDLELELIDYGAEDVRAEDDEVVVVAAFADFGQMQKALETRGLPVISSELQRIPLSFTELSEAQEEEAMKLIEFLEEDEDVQNVFHNLA